MPELCALGVRVHRRAVLSGLGAAPFLMPFEPVCAASPARYDIVVSSIADDTVVTTLTQALARAANTTRPLRIGIRPGVYREKVHIAVPGLLLEATGPGVVLTYNAAAGLTRPDGAKWGTGGSATLTIDAPGVTLRGLTIRNDFDFVADMASPTSGGAQAVALSIARAADRVLVDHCAIEGYQDTLYVASRALFDRCRISGGIDFIFGGAAAWFDRCDIVTRFVPGAEIQGYVAAPSTLADQAYGLVFSQCRLMREAGVPDRSAYLGRPWRAGGNMAILGMAAFLRCWMDAHIRPEGWTAMHYTDPAGQRRMLTPQEARLFEFESRGPGASAQRRLLSASAAARMTPVTVLDGWTSGTEGQNRERRA